MDVYFYCSYTKARLGFCLSKLEGNTLLPVNLSGSMAERQVNDFLFFDRFRVLWQELTPENAINDLKQPTGFRKFWQEQVLGHTPKEAPPPELTGGVFGMRSLQGNISDRDGVINFILVAGQNELELLQLVALGILASPDKFTSALFSCMEIGGPCGYQLNARAFWELINSIYWRPEQNVAHPLGNFIAPSVSEGEVSMQNLLRFAVLVSSWEQAREHFPPGSIWQMCPPQAINEDQFLSLYSSPKYY